MRGAVTAMACAAVAILGTAAASAQEPNPRSLIYIECRDGGSNGSGVVVGTAGLVLTAKHVAADVRNETCEGAVGTQSSASAMKRLRVVATSQAHDVALVQFAEHQIMEPFVPVAFDPNFEGEPGDRVVGYGFHPQKVGLADSAPGEVKAGAINAGGLLGLDMNTVLGMSGGPIFSDGKLVGLIKGERYDPNGDALETSMIVLAEVPEPQIVQVLASSPQQVQQDRSIVLRDNLMRNDVCTQLLREDITARSEHFPVAANIVADYLDEPENPLAATSEYWVTVTTGPAQWIDCHSGNLLKSFYFPMGMVVRPERDVDDGGTIRTVFLTEHGLRVFLDPAALRPVTPEVGYVFVVSDNFYKLCHVGEEACDPHREGFFDADAPEFAVQWPYLNGFDTYLRVPAALDDLDVAYGALADLWDFESNPPAFGTIPALWRFDLSDPESIPACAPRKAYLHSFYSHHDPTAPDEGALFPQPVRYSLCNIIDGRAFNRYERMKIVTVESAKRRFSNLWAVTTMHIVPDNIKNASQALFRQNGPDDSVGPMDIRAERQIVDEIRCDHPRGDRMSLGHAAALRTLTDVIEGDDRRHSIYRQFQVAQGGSSVDVFSDTPLFNEIEVWVECNGTDGLRDKGSLVVDLVPMPGRDQFELSFKDFYNSLSTYFGGLKGVPGIDVVNRRLKEGTLYRICEFSEYVAVRTVLYNIVKDSSRVQRARELLNVDLDLMTDHLIHLMMASAVSTDVRLRLTPQTSQGCET
ncbi:MAG: serine protease [Pseudomonadota bacterium]